MKISAIYRQANKFQLKGLCLNTFLQYLTLRTRNWLIGCEHTAECSLWLVGQSNAGRKNQMVEMNRMVEGQSGPDDRRAARPSQREWTRVRMSKHNVSNVATETEKRRLPFLVLDFSDAAVEASANRVGRCVSRVPSHPFIFIVNYLLNYLACLAIPSSSSSTIS